MMRTMLLDEKARLRSDTVWPEMMTAIRDAVASMGIIRLAARMSKAVDIGPPLQVECLPHNQREHVQDWVSEVGHV